MPNFSFSSAFLRGKLVTPPAGDNTARNLSIDFAYALSLGYRKEEYYLLIHADTVEMLWCAPNTSRAQPHELIQEFLNYLGHSSMLNQV